MFLYSAPAKHSLGLYYFLKVSPDVPQLLARVTHFEETSIGLGAYWDLSELCM